MVTHLWLEALNFFGSSGFDEIFLKQVAGWIWHRMKYRTFQLFFPVLGDVVRYSRKVLFGFVNRSASARTFRDIIRGQQTINEGIANTSPSVLWIVSNRFGTYYWRVSHSMLEKKPRFWLLFKKEYATLCFLSKCTS